MSFDNLINKPIIIPKIDPPHVDNSNDYVVVKKTKKGLVKVLKPELVREIKDRLKTIE